MYDTRLQQFQQRLAEAADLAFLPISADLQYLTGLPRDLPSFGAILHPGAWAEGLWVAPQRAPVLILTRMSAEFGGLAGAAGLEVRLLGDHDDPATLVRSMLHEFGISGRARIAISDRTLGETVVALQRLVEEAIFTSATDLLRPLRMIKAPQEMALLRRAGEITEAAFADVLAMLKPGMTELDIIAEVDYQLQRHGALGPSFPTTLYCSGPQHPLIFGKRSETQNRVLLPPVAVLFDFGAIYEGYCYDFGRTVAFGEPPAELRRYFDLVMASQAAGIAALRAGATCEQADAAARAVIAEAGLGDLFRHRLGHGIGLDVHEPPFLTAGDVTVLEEGMTFTVEPSITTFDGFSARVEDVVAVWKEGGEPLTRGFQTLYVVE